jgi:hypothetical protein
MRIDLTIRHNGKEWIVKSELVELSAPTLEELDEKLKILLREQEIVKRGEKASIFMAFDNATIPEWIRQYSQHYFNRILEFDGY